MGFIVSESNGVTTVTIHGFLDRLSGSKLQEEIGKLITAGSLKMNFNLAKVHSGNSAGITFLVTILGDLNQLQGRLTLSNLVPEMYTVIGSKQLFEIYPTQAEALVSFED